MADRDVTVGIKAEDKGYTARLLQMTAATKKFAQEGRSAGAAAGEIGRVAGGVGIAAAAGFGVAVAAAARFDSAMSKVQAATHESASNMDLLRQAAIKAGNDTQFSATEAAAGIEELAKAGVSTTNILRGGLRGALDLAAAGELDVADAAQDMATALTQFGLSGDKATHVADLLAAGAGKAQGSVSDMALALSYAGVPASQLGASIDETVGTLALFASNGVLAEKGGTALRGMLSSLVSPSAAAQKTMDSLGISVFDSQGKFIGLAGVAAQLQTQMAGLTDAERNNALGKIFSNAQLNAANILYKSGAAGVEDWTNKVNDSGYATETAALKMDNLAGDVEKFKSALETAFIGAGEGDQGALRGIVQDATAVVDAFNKMPGPLQNSFTHLAAIGALTAGSIWLGSKTIGKIGNLRDSINTLSETSPRAAAGLKLLAAAGAALAVLEVAAAGIRSIQEATDEALPGVEDLTARLIALKGGQVEDLGAEFDSLGDSIDRISDKSRLESFTDTLQKPFEFLFGEAGSLRQGRAEVEDLDAALANLAQTGGAAAAQQAFTDLAKAQGLSAQEQNDLRKLLPQYTEALQGSVNAANEATGANNDLARSTYKVAGGTEVTASQMEALKKAYQDARKAATDVAHQFITLGDSLDDSKVSLGEWIHQLEQQAQALANFRRNAEQAADKGLRHGLIAALEEAGPAGAMRMKQLANATESEIGRANKAWEAGQREVGKYVDATTKVPKELRTSITVESAQALKNVQQVSVALAGLNSKTIYVTTVMRTLHEESRLGPIHSATGGYIRGPGTGTSDSIPARLSNGEFVMNAAAVGKYGVGMMSAINARRFAGGGRVGSDVIPLPGTGGKYAPMGKPFDVALQNLFDIIDGHSKKIDKALKDFEPKLSQGVDGVTSEVHELRKAVKDAGGHWTKAMQEQADKLISAARVHDIGKAFKKFDVDVSMGSDGVRSEIRDFRQAVKEAGGEWNGALKKQSGKLVETASAYEAATQTLADSQGVLEKSQGDLQALVDQRASFAEQVGGNFNDSLFGNGLAGFDKTLTKNTGGAQGFQSLLEQLSAAGLDGELFKQVAASGDTKTAQQLLATGASGIDQYEQRFGGMQSAQQGLGAFAGDQVYNAMIAQQQQVVDANAQAVAANTAALTSLQAQLDRQEQRFDNMVTRIEDLPDRAHRGIYQGAFDGITDAAAGAARQMARSGKR